jgi:hypothetical protein
MVVHFEQHGDSSLVFSGVMPRLIMRPYCFRVSAQVSGLPQRRHLLLICIVLSSRFAVTLVAA